MNEQERKLRDEILEDAKRKAERALTRGKREAAKVREQAATEQQAERDNALQRAGDRAEAQGRAILATVDQEVRRGRLIAREEVVTRCLDEALAAARSLPPAEAQESLGELLSEAVAAFGPGPLTVRVHPTAAAAFSAERLTALGLAPESLEVVPDESVVDGLVAASPDGLRQFDNTYATRCKRLRERLRTLLADGIEF